MGIATIVAMLMCLYTWQGDQALFIMSNVGLAFHEASHVLFIWAPRPLYFAAGSIGQVAFPLLIAAYALTRDIRPALAVVAFAWASCEMWGVAEYMADAVTQSLPLIGGNIHDWNWLFVEYWNHPEWSESWPAVIRFIGKAFAICIVVISATVTYQTYQQDRQWPDIAMKNMRVGNCCSKCWSLLV